MGPDSQGLEHRSLAVDLPALTGKALRRQQLLRLDVSVRDLKQELERVVRAHNNAIREYEDKLTEYGIPSEEVGFRPVQEMIPGDLV